jgi:drug/metabolite transporter (DMT)-like permease
MKKSKLLSYVLLYIGYFLYSIVLVLAKFAGEYPLFSFNALLLYFFAFCFLGVFAILYQQVLKGLPLTVAYANRVITIPLGIMWGYILFSEEIRLNFLLGIIMVICGVVILVTKNE